MHPFKPSLAPYSPGAQFAHAATFERIEYLPSAQAVHVVAPVLVPAFVIEPAAQVMQWFEPSFPMYFAAGQLLQACMFERVEYLPAAHAVHVVAPAPVPLFVIDPGPQLMHRVEPSLVTYVAAAQSLQAPTLD